MNEETPMCGESYDQKMNKFDEVVKIIEKDNQQHLEYIFDYQGDKVIDKISNYYIIHTRPQPGGMMRFTIGFLMHILYLFTV